MQAELDRATPDLIALGALVLAFAGLITIHVALSYRIGRSGIPWRGLVALALPPLAPVWGWGAGQRWLSVAWVLFALGYVAAFTVASV